ncbi:glycerol-3-phosphate acyltransferase [Sphaerospermopsis kisseleviana CS-549]|uniref:Glycerol-3-phosphate acyltransferase n=1 Tax=Sphaerospermopsis kisseleviana CS-549 TaxID=3021783 RepID=A0ABT4ZVE4_9CYAN|nr:glycerol-3-phosphate acyltransferase [Sphaerospermopsis kisseleviana]MDB9443401.1 glycerol-3-phosphate acyltransferase [Sphaerospermopsis kisseleviana CS-549]BAZ80729.1 pyruvate phosphate dikinase PEP/pyruvate-binding protein [Sphaerospermopsis kisseleviana NIES-73]
MFQLWGLLVILITCPLLGAMPLIAWITYALKRQRLAQMGTGNISVSAAFYHGGKLVGILAVLSEAFKGIAAVSIARIFFPQGSFWELIALIALVIGRYALGKGAGTTNVVWGFLMHDPLIAGFVSLVAAIGFVILRSKQAIKYGVLILFPVFVAVLHFNDFPKILAAFALAGLVGWIYQQMPDDMDLPVAEADTESQPMMQYLSGGEQTIITLDDDLEPEVFGAKAATLSQIKRWGYPVPKGWILAPFDDPALLIDFLQPSSLSPLIVRSSAIGEDSQQASAAGQYETVLNVTSKQELELAIAQVQASYNHPTAVEYRRNLGAKDAAMAVLIQPQVQSVYSGVAFSRDPIAQQGDAVIIEAVSGSPAQVVSGKITPEQYRVFVVGEDKLSTVKFEGEGKIPQPLIKQVAYLARRLEKRYHGVPQDVEWSYDGQTLWVLQARPITTLLPIWTRKIAAEVIPGVIHPLTWSINLPLTCGMWGELFTIVLGDKTRELDFTKMATLHYSRAYFNASFLGEVFLEMGLPPESLDFLTRGAKMSKPPLASTLENLPGLTKLLQREISLEQEFKRDYRQRFIPGLTKLANEPIEELSAPHLLTRVDLILDLLNQGTYYSILSPLSAAIRQAVSGVKEEQIDHSITPEVASLRSLRILAADVQAILPEIDPERVFEQLAQIPEGQRILDEFAEILEDYGYLSEVGTDISVPRWKEQPHLVRQIFVQFIQAHESANADESKQRHQGFVQRRVDLKGRVTEVYSRLLAELRWTFLALEKMWLKESLLKQTGDIFFLKLGEVRRLAANADPELRDQVAELLQKRRSQFLEDSQITQIPPLVYGNNPPHPIAAPIDTSDHILLGIPASQGQAAGQVKVVRNLQEAGEINKQTILVVPYTDSGWATILVRAGGVIAEAGGKLSHGAIVAREYGIPAVMDVRGATYLLQDGQQVRIDGSKGIVELEEFLT